MLVGMALLYTCMLSQPQSTVTVQVPIFGQAQSNDTELWFYLEEAKKDKTLIPVTMDNLLLFFKLYNPQKQTLSYLGRCYAWETNRLPALMPFLHRKAQLPDGTALQASLLPCSESWWYVCTVMVSQQYSLHNCIALS